MHHPKQQDAERGQALAEFALTIPIFLMLVFGIIDLARLVAGFTQVIDAARQGVRYGIVEGLDADITQYLDCAGIEERVQETPGLIPRDDLHVEIRYLDPVDGSELHNCSDGDPEPSLLDEEVVLEVQVTGNIVPMTPAIALIDNSIGFDYTSERAITEGAYYTETWPELPPVLKNFNAEVDCTNGGRVRFSWEPMYAEVWPDRIEIRDSFTNETVASLNHPETGLSTCNDYDPAGRTACGTNISPVNGFGMWYAVVIQDGMEGPSTVDDTAECKAGPGDPGGSGGLVTINIYAFDDQNGNNHKGGNEGDFQGLKVTPYWAGPDNAQGGGDDVAFAFKYTAMDGTISFTGLAFPEGQPSTFYVQAEPPTGGYTVSPLILEWADLSDGAVASGTFAVRPSF